jgi:hypothetical protein
MSENFAAGGQSTYAKTIKMKKKKKWTIFSLLDNIN